MADDNSPKEDDKKSADAPKPAAPAAAAAKPAAAAHGAKVEPVAPPAEPGKFEQFLKEHGASVERLALSCGVETFAIDGEQLHSVLRLLKNASEVKLDLLLTVSGVDSAETFDSVYHLWSYDHLDELVIKVRIAKDKVAEGDLPSVPSIATIWPASNWHERETYDLVGIRYSGHPYPRRILNPWDWDGYPLRKDYKQPLDGLNDKNPHSMR
jgi:NADH-quinone oxidoreductase subunit C